MIAAAAGHRVRRAGCGGRVLADRSSDRDGAVRRGGARRVRSGAPARRAEPAAGRAARRRTASLERLSAQLRAEARSATAIWAARRARARGTTIACSSTSSPPTRPGPRSGAIAAFRTTRRPTRFRRRRARAARGACADRAVRPAAGGAVVLGGCARRSRQRRSPADAFAAHDDPYLGRADSPFVARRRPADRRRSRSGVLDAGGVAGPRRQRVVEVRIETGDGLAGRRSACPASFRTGSPRCCATRAPSGATSGTTAPRRRR